MKSFLPQKKFCWIYCGGADSIDFGEPLTSLVDQPLLNAWVDRSPELHMLGKITPRFFYSGRGSEMPSSVMTEAATFIAKHIDAYDGFVITHDLDRLIFHAALLTFMLGGTPKPIVFTCSPTLYLNAEEAAMTNIGDHTRAGSGLSGQLIESMQSTNIGFKEVVLFFHHRAIRATRAVYHRRGVHVLDTFRFPYLGDLEFGLAGEGKQFHPPTRLKFRPGFESRVAFSDTRWEEPQQFHTRMDAKQTQGLFLVGQENEALSSPWQGFVKQPELRRLPVAVFSSSSRTHPDLAPAFQVQHETLEVSLAKFFWILGQTENLKLIQQVMQGNVLGEKMSVRGSSNEAGWTEEQAGLSVDFREFLDIEL